MARRRTGRGLADGVHAVGAAIGANGKDSVLEIGGQILGRGHIGQGHAVFQRPLLFGGLDHAQIVDADVGVGEGHGLLLLGLQLLQMVLLQGDGVAGGVQVLRGLLAFGLQVIEILLKGGDLDVEGFILFSQAGDFLGLLARVGTFEFVQLHLGLAQVLLRGLQVRPGGVAVVIGAKKEHLRDQHQRQANPRKPAFGIHDGASCGVFGRRRQTRNGKTGTPAAN